MTLIKQPTLENILLAARNLKDGALIGLPTETVYGLAADAENKNAVRRIYEVKERPFDHPLIIHVGSLNYLQIWAKDIPNYAISLAEKYWPGPMTLILKRAGIARDFITGGQESIAIRIPNNQVSLSILNSFHHLGGNGLAAPSANKFKKVSPTSAHHVMEDIGQYLNINFDMIIDDGKCNIGLESTIINCLGTSPTILRPGAINLETKSYLYPEIKYSGNFERHYSPKTLVSINSIPEKGEGFIGLDFVITPPGAIRLLAAKDNEEFAREYYEALRTADKLNLRKLHVQIPEEGILAEAIRDRVVKSSYQE